MNGKDKFRVYPTLADRFQTIWVEGLLNEQYTAILNNPKWDIPYNKPGCTK
ncbi:MAG: hypothetical protein NVSMB7_04150 [Chitinophagaceae bacterium]